MEVREKWVEMMNSAMERHGQEQRPDARSWRDQGRHDLAELVEPKLRGIEDARLHALRDHVDGLREQRAELAPVGLSVGKTAEKIEERAELKVAEVREREAQEVSRLDKLIAAARELAAEVKERVEAVSQNVAEGLERFRARFDKWREERGESPYIRQDAKAASPAQEKSQRAGPEIDQRLQAFRERYAAHQKEREPAAVPEQKVEPPQAKPEEKQEQKQEQQISRGFGLGL